MTWHNHNTTSLLEIWRLLLTVRFKSRAADSKTFSTFSKMNKSPLNAIQKVMKKNYLWWEGKKPLLCPKLCQCDHGRTVTVRLDSVRAQRVGPASRRAALMSPYDWSVKRQACHCSYCPPLPAQAYVSPRGGGGWT